MDDNREKKKPRGRPFTGRGDPRNGPGRPKTGAGDPAAPGVGQCGDPDTSPLLVAMRHVFSNGPRGRESPGVRACRKFLADDPLGFLARLDRLERKYDARKGVAAPADPPDPRPEPPAAPDTGEEELRAILRKWGSPAGREPGGVTPEPAGT